MPSSLLIESGGLSVNTESTTASVSHTSDSSSDEDWESDVLDQGLAAHGVSEAVVRDSNCTNPTGVPEVTPPSKDAATSGLVYGICKVGAGGQWGLTPVM